MTHRPEPRVTSPIPGSAGKADWVRSAALVTSAALFFYLAGPARVAASRGAARQPLQLHHVSLHLPGSPAALVPADLNGDGRLDLAVVLAYTDVESIGEDRIEDMVQISTVIPALLERRELRVFLRTGAAALEPAGPPLLLPQDVLALERAPDGHGLLALTDAGVSRLDWAPDTESGFAWTTLIDDPPVLAGSGSFFSRLEWTHDLDGDGLADVVLPATDGPAIYLTRDQGRTMTPAQRLSLPGDHAGAFERVWRHYPLPAFRDVDGDGTDDLVSIAQDGRVAVFLGDGHGAFRSHGAARPDCPGAEALLRFRDAEGQTVEPSGRLAHFGDVDGSGRAEWITVQGLEADGTGLRSGLRQLKRPQQRFQFHRLREDLSVDSEPYLDFVAEGYAFEDVDFGAATMNMFQDLDGDGRADLITVTLRFSMLQALRVLATKRVSVGMDFHVRHQGADGGFRIVEGLDLAEKLRFDLDDLQLNRLAQFAGDFDGDGRTDFVHLGRGKQVTVHRGQAGCRYPARPDRVIELAEEPQDLGLVRVVDLDGDGRADLGVARSLTAEPSDVSTPVMLDLYLSGGGVEP